MKKRRLLILSVGYGQGHHAAAAALAEEFAARGWECRTTDPCQSAHPFLFRCTQAYYNFCVRRAPWLWGVTYAQTDTADWSRVQSSPILRDVAARVEQLLVQEAPDMVICTYPLYAYMLDALKKRGSFHGRYAVVVTDALVISRPWLLSSTPHLVVPDAASRQLVCVQFGLQENRVSAAGFPVRRAFCPGKIQAPTAVSLNITFGAYRGSRVVCRTVKGLIAAYPALHITLLAGKRKARFASLLAREIAAGNVEVVEASRQMPELFAASHLYIGKAGAATMFECYAARVPMIVNFALPGQEQGNLALLLRDGAGVYAESPDEVVSAVKSLLHAEALQWHRCRAAMAAAGYNGAAARIAEEVEKRFFA